MIPQQSGKLAQKKRAAIAGDPAFENWRDRVR